MGHIPLLDELAVIAAVAVIVTVVLSRLRLPTVAGLLLAGALLGPNGFGLARSLSAIEVLAEVGVVLLLFTIGLEFSLGRIRAIFRQVALGGLLQVGLTAAATAAISMGLGQPLGRSILYGFIFSLSSTAIVLRALAERRELDAPHGRFVVGTLIFQDLCVVPMMLIVPLLDQLDDPVEAVWNVSQALGKAAIVVVVTVVIAQWIVPRVLAWVDAARSREMFIMAVIGLCVGTAWITSLTGLSLALGAFLGGVVVADTEYGHRAMGDMLPVRDLFVTIFFVSLGMLFDIREVIGHPLQEALILSGFLLAKGFIATFAALVLGFPARVAWLSGVGLAQFGEFGFVLVKVAETEGIVDKGSSMPILTAGIISMFLTPVLVRAAPHFTAGEKLLAPLAKLMGVKSIDQEDTEKHGVGLLNHIVIVGYGLAGKVLAKSLAACDVPYIVLELNSEGVRKARAAGEPVFYADATSEEALEHAHVKQARALVILINDPQAAERVVATVNRVAPDLPVLMRTHYVAEKPRLLELGAADVVAEEVEGGVEVMSRLLRLLELPRNVIDDRIHDVRLATQTTERSPKLPRLTLAQHGALSELKIESVLVRRGTSAEGYAARELGIHQKTGALVVAVRRGEKLVESPGTTKLMAGDVVYLVGELSEVEQALRLIDGNGPAAGTLEVS